MAYNLEKFYWQLTDICCFEYAEKDALFRVSGYSDSDTGIAEAMATAEFTGVCWAEMGFMLLNLTGVSLGTGSLRLFIALLSGETSCWTAESFCGYYPVGTGNP